MDYKQLNLTVTRVLGVEGYRDVETSLVEEWLYVRVISEKFTNKSSYERIKEVNFILERSASRICESYLLILELFTEQEFLELQNEGTIGALGNTLVGKSAA